MGNVDLASIRSKLNWRMILPVFLVSIIASIDRVNIAYAKLTMTQDLPWITPEVFGFGAGIFFVGYVLLEIPGSLVAAHFSATKWIARIMFSWGLVCGCMAFVQTEFQFYLCRFLLGACEASLYPVIYSVLFPRWFTPGERSRATSLMLTSQLIASIIGAPLAGVLLESSFFGLHGWQELFILESVPALCFAVLFFFGIKDRPDQVNWLTEDEKNYLTKSYEEEVSQKSAVKNYSVWQAMRNPKVLKMGLIYFLWVVGFWGFNFWMPTVLKNLSGWSTALLGGAIAIPMTAAFIVQLIVSHTSMVTGDKVWHVAGALFVGAVGLACSPLATSNGMALFLICLSAIGIYASMGVWWTIPTTFLSGPAAAASVALINCCGNLGGLVGPNMMAFVQTHTGSFDVGYYIMGAFMLMSGLLVLTIKYKLNGEVREDADPTAELAAAERKVAQQVEA